MTQDEAKFHCWHRLQSFVFDMQAGKPKRLVLVRVDSLDVEGHELRVTRTVGQGREALDAAFGTCLFDLARLICERFRDGQVRIAAPSEWAWCSQKQSVEQPVRFFFETNGGDWYLNMATHVAAAPDFEGAETQSGS